MGNRVAVNMKKKILVEDVADSLKGLLYLIVWYYIGKCLSGMTLLFIGFVGLFTIPKLCEVYRRELDTIHKRLDQKYNEIMPKLQKQIPLLANQGHKNKSTKTAPPPPAEEPPKENKEEKTD